MNALLAGLTVLVIGDSHMVTRDYLITHLHDDLLAQGAQVDTFGMCGANAGDWVYPTTVSCGKAERIGKAGPQINRAPGSPTYQIDAVIDRVHPNLVVIEMGDTMAGYGQASFPQGWIYQQVHALTGRIAAHNVPCVWVGPPWGSEGSSYHKTFARVKEMSEFLATAVAPCRFIDSTQFSKQGEWPTIDGQHLTASGYKAWGADIAAALDKIAPELAPKP
ncbi:MAG: SGNH/GDSL hydrolase family protein [Alphaproteobacteria bacterium]|nr:SGNH/GDSL hydrolase family protein [Alphaproteobacteria bacterium]MBV9552995.1 SGNH/GDSL hydrolase family protein [Alphaproteobacteria bacterium]